MNLKNISSSTTPISTNRKIMLWGATGTRKTESVLRFFPNVMVIDTEGNVAQCVGMKEIPEFLYFVTKDPREALEIIDACADGKIKFSDGRPVLTLCVDSISVLWAVQQEMASASAEMRAERYRRDVSEATTTQLDWVKAKRPMKRINTRLNGSPIKYLVLIAREKDLYVEEEGKKDSLKKVGFTYDAMKGTDYEMNISLRMAYEEKDGVRGKWYCEVSKVQGALGSDLPIGKKFSTFPFEQIAKSSGSMKVEPRKVQDEDAIGRSQAEQEAEQSQPHTQIELLNIAENIGISKPDVGRILKEAGFTGFDPSKWEAMKSAIQQYALQHDILHA